MEIKIKKRRKEKVVQELHGRGGSRTVQDEDDTVHFSSLLFNAT